MNVSQNVDTRGVCTFVSIAFIILLHYYVPRSAEKNVETTSSHIFYTRI